MKFEPEDECHSAKLTVDSTSVSLHKVGLTIDEFAQCIADHVTARKTEVSLRSLRQHMVMTVQDVEARKPPLLDATEVKSEDKPKVQSKTDDHVFNKSISVIIINSTDPRERFILEPVQLFDKVHDIKV